MTVARQKHSLRVPPETVHIDFLVESDLELFALDLQDVKSSGATLIIVTPTPLSDFRPCVVITNEYPRFAQIYGVGIAPKLEAALNF